MSHELPGLGRRPDLLRELSELAPDPSQMPQAARVLAQHGDRWLVAAATAAASPPRLVPARGRLRDGPAGAPVTGDWVALDDGDAITAVLERRGSITRRAAGAPTAPQVLAANVDLALITEPAGALRPRRAERSAALAAAGGVAAAIVVTKADLDPDAHLAAARLAREVGVVDGFAVSASTGQGLDALRALLTPGTTAVLLGPSGAGKSTLLNALLGEQRMTTGAVRAGDGRGRHTTVTRELVSLPGGALLIDTPGMREVGLWDGDGGAFAEIDVLAAGCRFSDCDHAGEPGCAVVGAVPAERLAAWRKLAREQAWVDDRRAAAREREARGRGYARLQREARAGKGAR